MIPHARDASPGVGRVLELLRPLLTSAIRYNTSQCRRSAVEGLPLQRQDRRSPKVSCSSFTRATPDLPARCPDECGRPDPLLGYPHRAGLVSGSCSSCPRCRHRLPSDPGSRRQPLPKDGRLRSSRCVEDFHLLHEQHAWRSGGRAGCPARLSTPPDVPFGIRRFSVTHSDDVVLTAGSAVPSLPAFWRAGPGSCGWRPRSTTGHAH